MQRSEASLYLKYSQLLKKNKSWAFEPGYTRLSSLPDLVQNFDAFFFDGFGTLYNLATPHKGASEALQFLRKNNKQVRLITNAASRPVAQLQAHLQSMNIQFNESEIISSGSLLKHWNSKQNTPVTSAFHVGRSDALYFLEEAKIQYSDTPAQNNVILTGALPSKSAELMRAKEILQKPNATLIVLNPDAWAPNTDGTRIPVSGVAADQLQEETGCQIISLGKPFPDIFELALESLPHPSLKTIMIGDTLGTDIMGAKSIGISSALVLGGNSDSIELSADQELLQTCPDFLLHPNYPLD